MSLNRASGILLHISSLPGKYGIGDTGEKACEWIDFLESTGTKFWQILPLNPTGYGNSPYQGLSAFAGNPLFIDCKNLYELGLLNKHDLDQSPKFPLQKVDFKKVIPWKSKILDQAFKNFLNCQQPELKHEYEGFKGENASWLKDYSLFMALREEYQLVSWNHWPDPFRLRDPQALRSFEEAEFEKVELHNFFQFIFSKQWKKLKTYANSRGIHLIGDIPIFMGYDCADVWAYPQLFQLDKNREPTAVAGVPPDFFSETGQLWGNPLYNWELHKQENYAWWIRRVKETLTTVDMIRLDHFRGFAGYFKIPAGSKTAKNGEWVPGPGRHLFDAMQAEISRLPFIAEDLGVITPDVVELRERYDFPGMRLLQFAFREDTDHEFLPHNYPANCVVYTGTHDNDTSVGWYQSAPEHERLFCSSYLGHHTRNIAHEMICAIWRSDALIAIAPMQDFLRLGGWARMNLPATVEGNWLWRMKPDALTGKLADWIKEINITFDRVSGSKNWPSK